MAVYLASRQSARFRKAEAAAVDELERDAVAAEADVLEELADLGSGEHGGQLVVVFGLDLGEDLPVFMSEHLDWNGWS